MSDTCFIKCLFFVAGLSSGVVDKAGTVSGGALMGGALGAPSEYN